MEEKKIRPDGRQSVPGWAGTGRHRVDDRDHSVGVHVVLSVTQYDDLYRRARLDGISVPERIRRDIAVAKKNAK